MNKSLIIDLKKTSISSLNDFENIVAELSNSSEIENLKNEIDALKKKINIYEELKNYKVKLFGQDKFITSEIEKYNKKLDTLSEILKHQNNLKLEIQKFKDLESKSNEAESIKLQRINSIKEQIETEIKNRKKVFVKIQEVDHAFIGKGITGLMSLQVFTTLVLYLYTHSVALVSLSFFTLLINFVIISILNISKQQSFSSSIEGVTIKKELEKEPVNIPYQNDLLINLAWLDALKFENQRLNESVKLKLKGKDIDEVRTYLSNLVENKSDVEKKLMEMENKLNESDYLKIKAKLDILEIELESALSNLGEDKITIKNLSILPREIQLDIKDYVGTHSNIVMEEAEPVYATAGRRQLFTKLSVILFVIFLIVLPISPVYAKTSQEIQDEINQQMQDLTNTQSQLSNAQSQLQYDQEALSSSQEGLPKIEAQIKEIQSQIDVNNAQLKVVQSQNDLLTLQKEQLKMNQLESVKNSYMDWRITNGQGQILKPDEVYKNQKYAASLIGLEGKDISDLVKQIEKVQKQLDEQTATLKQLNDSNTKLATQKQELLDSISYFAYSIANGSQSIASLQQNVQELKNQISFLSTQQQEAQQRELEAMQNVGAVDNSGCDGATVQGGQFYFCGQGRDLVMGHGVGMSQYGAQGAAALGYNSTQILQFYYSGASVNGGYENTSVNVDGYGWLNIEDYAAGQGEVPSHACGTQDQVNSNPSKYVLNSSYCWPEETIKAQVIAYRTYGVYNSGFVYNDARSQVYNGSQSSRWAADETRGQVITYGGSVIEALYSADNNQGYGTADVGTRFQDFWGNPSTNAPYLTSVNDNAFAANSRMYWNTYCGGYACGLWPWKTQTYSFSDLDSMFSYAADNIAGEMYSVKSSVGNVISLNFQKDASNRIKKVIINGTNGQVTIGGWWFKYMWNIWTDAIGREDFIFSQTTNIVE